MEKNRNGSESLEGGSSEDPRGFGWISLEHIGEIWEPLKKVPSVILVPGREGESFGKIVSRYQPITRPNSDGCARPRLVVGRFADEPSLPALAYVFGKRRAELPAEFEQYARGLLRQFGCEAGLLTNPLFARILPGNGEERPGRWPLHDLESLGAAMAGLLRRPGERFVWEGALLPSGFVLAKMGWKALGLDWPRG